LFFGQLIAGSQTGMHPSPDTVREEVFMSKEEVLEFEGIVTEVLPDSRFRVKLENDHEIIAYTAGKMKKFRIRTIAGDRVTVEMTPYDLDKGRITFRHKDTKSGSPPPPGQNQNRRPGGNRR
jgi:translation initiation factor IF-1